MGAPVGAEASDAVETRRHEAGQHPACARSFAKGCRDGKKTRHEDTENRATETEEGGGEGGGGKREKEMMDERKSSEKQLWGTCTTSSA